MFKYIYWVKTRLVWVFLNIEERGKANEIGLKEGGEIEMSTTVLHSRAAPSLAYLPTATTSIKDKECLINVSI